VLLHGYGEDLPGDDRGRDFCPDLEFTCTSIGQLPIQLIPASQGLGQVCIGNIDETEATANAENGNATTARTSIMVAYTVFLPRAIG
jgi:hypothetical protein